MQGTKQKELGRAEQRAMECHWKRLCKEAGKEVPYEVAMDDWLDNHATAWREEHQRRVMERQKEEMNKHRWIESEKAQCDLGSKAYIDWIKNYAAQWRSWYEREIEGLEVEGLEAE
ncbi:MAG: hypothetical protein R6W89_10325 [Candidatus Hydrogenedentota bacterium]